MPAFDDVRRPTVVDDAEWNSIVRRIERIRRAQGASDWELAVGSAKELCEGVAKLVLQTAGETFGSRARYPGLITSAHRILDRQPGEGLATEPPVRDIARSAKTLALKLVELRSTHGTGHGRVVTPDVVAEHGEICSDAALVWTRWALRRLDVVREGRVVDIIRDLRSETFSRGDLARRLIAADVAALELAEQRALGLAVGRRAASRTFVVRQDGVEAAANDDPMWTDDYRLGVIEGAFIDEDGYLRSESHVAGAAVRLIELVGDRAVEQLETMLDRTRDGEFSYAMRQDDRAEVVSVLTRASECSPEPIASSFRELSTRFVPKEERS